MNRVAIAIVVKVNVNIFPHQAPLVDAVAPPAEAIVRVRAGVKIMLIRAVHTDVNKRRCCAQDTWSVTVYLEQACSLVLLQVKKFLFCFAVAQFRCRLPQLPTNQYRLYSRRQHH